MSRTRLGAGITTVAVAVTLAAGLLDRDSVATARDNRDSQVRAIAVPRPAPGGVVPPAAVTWQPPIGIPAPSFGIRDAAPPPPSPWTNATAGFYYVDPTASRATDANNPFGTPASPRATVPTRLPAGSVVELRGTYEQAHADGNRIQASGTAAQPVFIRGASPTQQTDILRAWEVSGSYVILEHLRFRAKDRSTTGTLAFLSPLDHGVLRFSDISGTPDAGGLGIEAWTAGTTTSHVVIWNNKIHDNGNVAAGFDQDRHGIHVGDHVSHVWVLDNEMWRNSGDGIQISARTAANQPTTHHIYVGRNTSHHNKQNGFWTKQAVDVIFSQNTSYANRPSNSSVGAGLGFQYAPDYVWFLFNHVYDSDYGINTGSDSGLGTGSESFYIGNLIHDIHTSTGEFKPGTGWQNCGISLPGGVNRYVVNNTIINADSGICTPSSEGKLEIHNNLIFGTRADGQHVFLEHTRVALASKATGNVFGPNYRAMTGGVAHAFDGTATGGRGENAVLRDPGFARTTGQPYDLLLNSPAVDFGIDDPAGVYRIFRSRYGIDIQRDILGRSRPAGRGYDAGAYEAQSGAPQPGDGQNESGQNEDRQRRRRP